MNDTELLMPPIIPIMPQHSFFEVMEFVDATNQALQAKGIKLTYVYEVDPIYASEARLYVPLINDALDEYLEERSKLDIWPHIATHEQLPCYFRLMELLEEFHYNCSKVYYKDKQRRRNAFFTRRKTQTYITRLK